MAFEIAAHPRIADQAHDIALRHDQIEYGVAIACGDVLELALQSVHLVLHAGHLLGAQTANVFARSGATSSSERLTGEIPTKA